MKARQFQQDGGAPRGDLSQRPEFDVIKRCLSISAVKTAVDDFPGGVEILLEVASSEAVIIASDRDLEISDLPPPETVQGLWRKVVGSVREDFEDGEAGGEGEGGEGGGPGQAVGQGGVGAAG